MADEIKKDTSHATPSNAQSKEEPKAEPKK